MPTVDRLLETALYFDDLPRAKQFYEELFGLTAMVADDRFCAMDVNGKSVLLLFHHGATTQGLQSPAGWIPPHDASGSSHMAFAIAAAEYDDWKNRLLERGIAIESETRWARGGRSLYFRDPEGHSLELATPGLWASY